MKYNVKVGIQTFEVEIEDLNARPVLARVGEQVFEITPGNETVQQVSQTNSVKQQPKAVVALPGGAASQHMSGNDLVAPLPGTVIEIFVKAGDKVEAGQVVLIIDAMKMKNSIRSVRAGIVGQVLVAPGQSVAHRQSLIRFADSGEASWI